MTLLDLGCKRAIPERLAGLGLEVLVVLGDWDADAVLETRPAPACRQRPGRVHRARSRPSATCSDASRCTDLPRAPAPRPRAGARDVRSFGHRARTTLFATRQRPRPRHRPEPRLPSRPTTTTSSRTSRSTTGRSRGSAGEDFASVQFHPEAAPGPRDGLPSSRPSPRHAETRGPSLVLIVGSGPIRIGQACEFDYSGAQARRVLRREGLRVVLVNSNPATIMTDPEWADATYLEPLDAETVAEIVERERPDALLPTLAARRR